jgi:hypothetical protein
VALTHRPLCRATPSAFAPFDRFDACAVFVALLSSTHLTPPGAPTRSSGPSSSLLPLRDRPEIRQQHQEGQESRFRPPVQHPRDEIQHSMDCTTTLALTCYVTEGSVCLNLREASVTKDYRVEGLGGSTRKTRSRMLLAPREVSEALRYICGHCRMETSAWSLRNGGWSGNDEANGPAPTDPRTVRLRFNTPCGFSWA